MWHPELWRYALLGAWLSTYGKHISGYETKLLHIWADSEVSE